jgi:prepilin-type N-terminal cleavage/methylation domain-containing protein/prepilin-type processing-associated H-X9-DG protein
MGIEAMERRKGFTLIELLVVIAIIALLMAILMPALEAARKRAQDLLCMANQRSVGLGILLYLQDHDGVLADASSTNGWRWVDPATGWPMKTNQTAAYWGIAYIDYIKDKKIFGCPAYKSVAGQLINTAGIVNSDETHLLDTAAFGLNNYASNRRATEIRNHSKFIFCTDHVEPRVEQDEIDMFHNNDGQSQWNLAHYRPGGRADRMPLYRGIFRHAIKFNDDFRTGGYADALWLDGHASRIQETLGQSNTQSSNPQQPPISGPDIPKKWYTGN